MLGLVIMFDSLIRYFSKVKQLILVLLIPSQNGSYWEGKGGESSKNGYLLKINDISNNFIYDNLKDLSYDSVLEIGSNCGNRLIQKAIENPHIMFTGIDINLNAIQIGQSYASKHKINNLNFLHYDVESEEFFKFLQQNKFDIIFAWATLIYVHPLRIIRLMRELILATNNRLIIIEQHSDNLKMWPTWRGVFIGFGPNWVRNYRKILFKTKCKFVSSAFIEVPKDIWSPGGGMGYLIKVSKTK